MDKKPVQPTIDSLIYQYLEPQHSMDPIIVGFINVYLQCRHAGEAAKLVGLKPTQGVTILNKPDVQECIKQINLVSGRKANFDASEILERTNEIAQYDPIEVFNRDGTVKAIDDIPASTRRAIKKLVVREVWEKDINGMDVHTGYIKTIEFYDKLRGLEMIGKYDGVFKDETTIKHEIGGNLASVLLAKAEERALGRDVTDTLRLTDDPIKNSFAIEAMKVEIDD